MCAWCLTDLRYVVNSAYPTDVNIRKGGVAHLLGCVKFWTIFTTIVEGKVFETVVRVIAYGC